MKKCRYHFSIVFDDVKKCLNNYKKHCTNKEKLLSEAAIDELKESFNDPTTLWFRLDPGNKDLFLKDEKEYIPDAAGIFNQFVSSLTTYFYDSKNGKDWITYLWGLNDDKIKKYVDSINKMHSMNCEGEKCKGWGK